MIFNFKELEEIYQVAFPDKLIHFLQNEYKNYNHFFISGLPNYEPESSYQVKFDDESVHYLFGENEISNPNAQGEYFIPLTKLYYSVKEQDAESQFLAINANDNQNLSVFMWDHEDGKFHIAFKSFDEFLSKLKKKKK